MSQNSSNKLEISMSKYLIQWNTARIINKSLNDIKFMKGYEGINTDIYVLYKEITLYHSEHYAELLTSYGNRFGFEKDIYEEWVSHLDSLVELQRLIKESNDTDAISKKAIELFDNKDVTSINFVDLEILNKLEILLDYSEPIRNLFNFIVPLIKPKDNDIPYELEQELREILNQKGLGSFKIPDLSNNNQSLQLS